MIDPQEISDKIDGENVPSVENEDEILKNLRYLSRLDSWFHNNLPDIRKKHPDEWVIIKGFKVVDSDKDFDAIRERHKEDKKKLLEYVSTHTGPFLFKYCT